MAGKNFRPFFCFPNHKSEKAFRTKLRTCLSFIKSFIVSLVYGEPDEPNYRTFFSAESYFFGLLFI
ncbi:hypothetical protein CMU36_08480 [Elizabethkingia anophelis]|nr:hypothetical protein [Elizabethkingia anophelis]MDV3729871.1 hypothetical protein [Elizabethkingia anophelis]MDV3777248.1 hypothetical protein [Elizabethkingia anophelis]MDV3788847.1 hypothetical protein [Elizabethkingia anophelis]MDV3805982.1 hypothetical protein [Elizabethkingia anophelis]